MEWLIEQSVWLLPLERIDYIPTFLDRMTYCVAVCVDEGLVFASDSRTNAGIDQVSTYGKMHTFGIPGERLFVLMSAGNLATTQAVVTRIRRDIDKNNNDCLYKLSHMSDAAEYLGRINLAQQKKHRVDSEMSSFNPEATFILGGQITSEPPAIFLIYSQGNYITTSEHTPFLQIGEGKYGKPILDRIILPDTPLEDAARCCLVSMVSTMRSNASVGPPIELLIYRKNWLRPDLYCRFDEDHSFLIKMKKAWERKMKEAFRDLPYVDCNGSIDDL